MQDLKKSGVFWDELFTLRSHTWRLADNVNVMYYLTFLLAVLLLGNNDEEMGIPLLEFRVSEYMYFQIVVKIAGTWI